MLLLDGSLRGAPGPVHPGTLDPRPLHGVVQLTSQATAGRPRGVCASRASRQRATSQRHLRDQGLDASRSAPWRAAARRSRRATPLAVQVEVVAVQHVRLDPALDAVEGRVRADGDGGRQRRGVGQVERGPASRRRRRRRAPAECVAGQVGGREAEVAAAVVAVHDHALDPVRAAEHLRGRGPRRPRRAARGPSSTTSAGTPRRRDASLVTRGRSASDLDVETALRTEITQRGHVAAVAVPEPGVGARRRPARRAGRRRTRSGRTARGSTGRTRG